MLKTIFNLIVYGLIFYVLYWLILFLALPEPFAKVSLVILACSAAYLVIKLLLGLIGKENELP